VNVRRVVTGHRADGTATVVDDGPPPRSHDFVAIDGMRETLVWVTAAGAAIVADGADPTPSARDLPGTGGTRFAIVRFPPDAVYADPAFDGAAAAAEHLRVSPELAALFEPDAPGMHTTDTVDYAIVLEGEIWLELDDDELVHLARGDVVVQNGTRHAWRNRSGEPATVAFVNVGAERRPQGAT
jgi:mannose-6-phosphate isomerase-like protein (cupin superfamily)